MSTRACIARRHGDGFLGVYHHWDGYPSQLGRTLWEAAHRVPLADLLRLLIDDHPAGWSTIVDADLSLPPGYLDRDRREAMAAGHRPPECYCHGTRSEKAQPMTQDDDAGMEWAYVFDEETGVIAVLERLRDDDDVRWTIRAVVPLDGPEPNWRGMEPGEEAAS